MRSSSPVSGAARLHAARLCCLAAALVVGGPAPAAAQDGPIEAGLHAAFLRLDTLDATPVALGGRLSIDLFRWAAFEAELDLFPNDDVTITNAVPGVFAPEWAVTYRRSRLSGFFGPKVGYRGERLGIFALVRPGFTRLEAGEIDCEGPGCAVILIAPPTYRTELAVDLGGALELYFPSGAMVRVDAADTIIRHRSLAPPCARCTTHNLTVRAGIGVRF